MIEQLLGAGFCISLFQIRSNGAVVKEMVVAALQPDALFMFLSFTCRYARLLFQRERSFFIGGDFTSSAESGTGLASGQGGQEDFVKTSTDYELPLLSPVD
jgi:hypothetical protein